MSFSLYEKLALARDGLASRPQPYVLHYPGLILLGGISV